MSGGPARAAPGARFACQGSGFCCRFHQLGPLDPAWLQALGDAGAWWPRARDGVAVLRGGALELRKIDGACLFLDEDHRCALHTRGGPEAKPAFCRLFPYRLVEDPEGLAITVHESCSGRAGPGPLLAEAAAEVGALARAGGAVTSFAPARVALLPGWELDLPAWMAAEAALLADLPGTDLGGEALVAWVRDRLAAGGGAPPFAADPARARLAARAALVALEMTLDHVQRTEVAPSPAEAAFVTELHQAIAAAGVALARGEAPPWPPPVRAYLRDLLRDGLLGKDLHALGSLGAGLGRFLLTAQVAAFAAGPGADAPAFGRAHSRLARFVANRSMHAVLRKAAPALLDMVRFS